jgi:mono/diheme cytochrome c family protein
MSKSLGWSLIAMIALALAGCSESSPPPFRLNMELQVEKQIVPAHRQQIADVLGAMFGTPDHPYALPETGLDQRKLQMAAGPVWSDEIGGKHGLYRRHCAHCHGISGDGQGSTAAILNPYPRDYRPGIYKFKSTFTAAQPTDQDLYNVLHNGVPGTAMPSFALLPPDEVSALLEYVKYLSMRGQMERALVNYVAEDFESDPLTGEAKTQLDPANNAEQRSLIVNDMLGEIVTAWKESNEQVMVPETVAVPAENRPVEVVTASATKGRDLFYGTKANCLKCHGPTALGDGQQDDFDIWSKANKKFIDDTEALAESIQEAKKNIATLQGEELAQAQSDLKIDTKQLAERRELIGSLLPVRNAIPRNLREGTYRGGRRPLDIFWRLSSGIAGTPMPAGGPATAGAQGTLTQEEVWQIVDYVQSLPFEPASRPQRRPLNAETVNN